MVRMTDSLQTDDRFVADFLAGSIAPETFDHRAHLRAAACLLRRMPFLEACIAMRDGLRHIAARAGKPGLYHETITVALMSLVLDRIADEDDGSAGEDGAGLIGTSPSTHPASRRDAGPRPPSARAAGPAGDSIDGTDAGADATPAPGSRDFDALLSRCPELLDRGLLARYYRPDMLASDAARRRFVLPGPSSAAEPASAAGLRQG